MIPISVFGSMRLSIKITSFKAAILFFMKDAWHLITSEFDGLLIPVIVTSLGLFFKIDSNASISWAVIIKLSNPSCLLLSIFFNNAGEYFHWLFAAVIVNC